MAGVSIIEGTVLGGSGAHVMPPNDANGHPIFTDMYRNYALVCEHLSYAVEIANRAYSGNGYSRYLPHLLLAAQNYHCSPYTSESSQSDGSVC